MFGIRIVSVVAAMVAVIGLAGCSQSSLTTQDAYKIGCPAIDATVASGSVANEVAVSTLKEIRDSAHPSADTKKWVDAAIRLLTSDHPGGMAERTKKLIIQGCRQNGYPLQNLK